MLDISSAQWDDIIVTDFIFSAGCFVACIVINLLMIALGKISDDIMLLPMGLDSNNNLLHRIQG